MMLHQFTSAHLWEPQVRRTLLAFSGKKSFEMPGDLDNYSYRKAVHKVLENKASFKHIHIPFLEHGNGRGKHTDGESDYPAPRWSSFPATAWTAPVSPLLPFPQEWLGAPQREEAGPCLCFTMWLWSQVDSRAGERIWRPKAGRQWEQHLASVSPQSAYMAKEKQTVGSDLTDGNQTALVKSETSPGFTWVVSGSLSPSLSDE